MSENSGRSINYRYSVPPDSSDLTPLSQIEVYFGPLTFRVLNVSQGGLALLFGSEPKVQVGDIIDASVGIRDRAFPVQLEIKSIHGFRVGAEFILPSQIFLGALKEFLQPKTLGATFRKQEYVFNFEELKTKVEGAQAFEVYQGDNLSFLVFWLTDDRQVLAALGWVADLAFYWTPQSLFKSGRVQNPLEYSAQFFECLSQATFSKIECETSTVVWDRACEPSVQHYFADIFLSWMSLDEGKAFVSNLTGETALSPEKPFRLPK